jgi:tetratricopeptide (TPR) repeat protein
MFAEVPEQSIYFLQRKLPLATRLQASKAEQWYGDARPHAPISLTQAHDEYKYPHASRNLSGLQHLYAQPDYPKAIAHFGKAIFLGPEEPAYYWHRAEAHLRAVEFESCIANFKWVCFPLGFCASVHAWILTTRV